MGKAGFVMAVISIEAYDDRGSLVDAVLGGWSTSTAVESLHSVLMATRASLVGRWDQASPQAIRTHIAQQQRPQLWEQLDLFS